MPRRYIHERLNPLPISILYVLIGGMWTFTTLFLFSDWFPDLEIVNAGNWPPVFPACC